ncbi:MAG: DUF1015 domain-containing protein [Desulfobacteraceae bacterium]
MAEIIPFKGILYNIEKIHKLEDVVAPPYDVISSQEQDDLYDLHPNNMIRLILGKPEKSDTQDNNPHTRAAQYLSQWINARILKRDETPSYYLKSIEFTWNGKQYTRYGLITLVRIESFDKGIILPHEKTFSRVKSERLNLLKICNTNFDPVFALYPDNNDTLSLMIQKIHGQPSDLSFRDHYGHHHRVWRLTDPDFNKTIANALATESLFIADGHHRYETALTYRNWLKDKNPEITAEHPSNFIMMYLSSMKDPGLTVLPAHRLVKKVDDQTFTNALQNSQIFFEVTSFPFNDSSREMIQTKFLSQLHKLNTLNAIGVLHKSQPIFHLLTLKPDAMERLFADTIPSALKKLDVTVLTHLIFMELLGFDQEKLDDEYLIGYNSREDNAIEKVISGEYDAVFILNPTKIEQVRSVALNRLTMPRKSTYFYPKVISGVVQNILQP